jgi:Ca-activated chloride channel family protein
LDALDEGAREDRVLVVVTDGEDHEAGVDAQLQRAAEAGVQIHTVGIGSPEGVPIPIPGGEGVRQGFLRDEDGGIVTTRLDEATLRSVAQNTGGRYVRVASAGTALDDLVDEIASAEGEEIDAREITQFEEQYQLFLGLALGLLLLEAMISDRGQSKKAWGGRFA